MSFPTHLLSPNQKALSLFCAAFGGAQDVFHLRKVGITNITLVDNDKPKLLKMTKAGDLMHDDDCFKVIDHLHHTLTKNQDTFKKYDIITSDQWTNQDKLIHEDYLPKLKSICKGWLIIGISKPYLDTIPQPERSQIITNQLTAARSNYLGGIYWRVIDCRGNKKNDDLA